MRILLGVSGSISAYKAIDLARAFINDGHEVKVVLTKGALEFLNPNTFKYLGVISTHLADDDFAHAGVLHVELGRWCDKFVIAPLSANTLSRFVHAEASDLLSSIFLAFEKTKPILVFPAMNTEMLTHPFVEENFESIKKLKTLNNIFVSNTNSGKLACNDEGAGKLATVEEIKELTYSISHVNNLDSKIIITTGATIAPLDPVRFLTNSSSGITGFALAKTYLELGHQVIVIAGRLATEKLDLLLKHPNYKLIRVSLVDEMFDEVHRHIKDTHIFISSAAVSDIEFVYEEQKIKKDKMTNSLNVKPAKDILKSVIDLKQKNLKIVGFAAETDLSDSVLEKKMNNKPVDLLVGTKVHNGIKDNSVQGFNNISANYRLMAKTMGSNQIVFEGELSKDYLGVEILKRLNL